MNVRAKHRYDVVVIGYGYAGAVSAISAHDAGANVLLLEKAPRPGGISICSAGGLRIAFDAAAAFEYLHATCGGKTPDAVLRQLAQGMAHLPEQVRRLAESCAAQVSLRPAPANYPLPGCKAFGFVTIEAIAGFDPDQAYPHVCGSNAGALLFRVLEDNIGRRRGITVATATAAARLLADRGRVVGVALADGAIVKAGGVILTCGGFEADAAMQAQYWPGGPALSAAYGYNQGDGIRMAQAVGADLWHMWHYHGCYGYRSPDPSYPYAIRVKRLPDWQPGDAAEVPVMSWILLDQGGRRFMNEYEPYVQDTGHRPLGVFDPASQCYPRNPAYLITDEPGRRYYPLGKPTYNDAAAKYIWSADNSREIDSGLFRRAASTDQLAGLVGADASAVKASIEAWNAGCRNHYDALFQRPPGSLHPLTQPPFYVAEVYQIVSNTQGGPVHDEHQRVLDPFGAAIPGLYAAGECGSAFGHLYLSGGNLAECFVGGAIAGRNAASGAHD